MISVEDKIDIFKQELTSQLAAFKKESMEKAEETNKLLEEKADVSIKQQNDNIKRRFNRLENRDVSRILAEGKNEARDIILNTKKEIRTDFYESLLKRVNEIIKTDSYKNYFRKNLEEVRSLLKGSDIITLFINESEQAMFNSLINEILSDFKIRYETLPEKNIGGFLVHDQNDRVSYDYSLENLINESDRVLNYYFNQLVNGEIN